jgi:hypothetical protein
MNKAEEYAIKTAIGHYFSSHEGMSAEELYEWLLKNQHKPATSWPKGIYPCFAYEEHWVDSLAAIVFSFKHEIEDAIKWAIQEKDLCFLRS